ncbi:hypothetical protein P7C71_g5157, partial [Lecanoromycetidae sp. Uapishka_2]
MSGSGRVLCGVVVSAGKMMRAVKVRTARQVYNSFLKKHFLTYQSYLVSDPNSSLRTGDVVKILAEKRVSRHIKHVVSEIVAPWGPGIDERPPVMTAEERFAKWKAGKDRKMERRRLREEAASEGNQAMGVQDAMEGTAVTS